MPNTATQSAATETEALDLSATVVIGLYHRPEGDVALVRTSDGAVHRLTAGDRVGAYSVTAFDTDALILTEGSEVRRLVLGG